MSAHDCFLQTNRPAARVALLLVLSALAACATRKGVELPDISEWSDRTLVLAEIDQFDFSGRIGVKAGDDGFNGKLRWSQDESAFSATLGGPLGIGTVRLEGDGRKIEITEKDGEKTVLEDVEVDLYYRYGWTLPVESLRYWALGIPDPRVPAETEFNEAGELIRLAQRGWTVDISRYREVRGGQKMPARLNAKNSETSVRLLIDRWVFHELVSP